MLSALKSCRQQQMDIPTLGGVDGERPAQFDARAIEVPSDLDFIPGRFLVVGHSQVRGIRLSGSLLLELLGRARKLARLF